MNSLTVGRVSSIIALGHSVGRQTTVSFLLYHIANLYRSCFHCTPYYIYLPGLPFQQNNVCRNMVRNHRKGHRKGRFGILWLILFQVRRRPTASLNGVAIPAEARLRRQQARLSKRLYSSPCQTCADIVGYYLWRCYAFRAMGGRPNCTGPTRRFRLHARSKRLWEKYPGTP